MEIDINRLDNFIKSDDFEQGTVIINKLLSHWSLPRWKDDTGVKSSGAQSESDREYLFILRHQAVLGDILAISGYILHVEDKPRGREFAYITAVDPLPSFQKLYKPEATAFLCLRVLYEEHMRKVTMDSRVLNAKIVVDDLLSLICAYKKNANYKGELSNLRPILYKLENLNVCRVEGPRKDFGPDSIITIFPTIIAFLPSSEIESVYALLEEYKAETLKKIYLEENSKLPLDKSPDTESFDNNTKEE